MVYPDKPTNGMNESDVQRNIEAMTDVTAKNTHVIAEELSQIREELKALAEAMKRKEKSWMR
jgi:hypothetical protein